MDRRPESIHIAYEDQEGIRLEIQVEEVGEKRIIRLIGRLDGTSMQQAEDVFIQLASSGITHFIYDLSRLDYISSAGLRVMLLSVKKTRAAGGKLALYGLIDNVSEIFRISGFSTIFTIVDSEAEALAYVS